jgi:hypothetical protein
MYNISVPENIAMPTVKFIGMALRFVNSIQIHHSIHIK